VQLTGAVIWSFTLRDGFRRIACGDRTMKRLLLLAAAPCLAIGAAMAREPTQGELAAIARTAGQPRAAIRAYETAKRQVRVRYDSFLRNRAGLASLGAEDQRGFEDSGRLEFVQVPIQRAGGPRLRTSLNAYSFNKTLNDHLKGRGKGMTLFELLDFCAEENFDAIDPTGYFFPGYPKVPSDKYLNDFKRRAFVLGLDISGTGVRNDFATADKARRAADVQHVKEWVEVAARMGAPVLRVFAGTPPAGHSWDEVAQWMVADLKQCVEHGKKHGVLIGIQNHNDFLKTAEQTLKIVKMVDSEWFGVIVDTGYFLTADPYKDMAAVAPYAVNWQVKTHIGGKGATIKSDVKKIVRIARAAGYRGYLPIETLPVPGEVYDPRLRAREALKDLRAALQQAE
jgi:sugar phosphate isomerase/epimerase